MTSEKAKTFSYGGQAVIEGVMMRGKEHFSVACRRANGEVVTTTENVEKGVLGKLKWLNKPFLRGTLAMVDTMLLGMKSLMWSANISMEDEQSKDTGKEVSAESKAKSNMATSIALGVTPFLAIGASLLIFLFLPIVMTKWAFGGGLVNIAPDGVGVVYRGLTEGAIKLTFFVLYVWGISFMKDIHRVFEYHGAEHKIINTYEAGEALTVDNCRKHTTLHVRCGTSFILIVILVSILIFAAVPWQSVWQRLAYKLVLMPIVAGISYEVIKFAGARKNSPILKVLLFPGLLMQKITTQEPSDDQLEIAIKSLDGVFEAEQDAAAS